MAKLSKKDISWLQEKFGSRVTFDKTERVLYGHDIAAMPKLFKPLIGNTTPDAVVQPQNEAELVALVKWAAERKIPITPRAKASSGYGGVLPTRKGIVVDFYRMKEVLEVNQKDLTVTVQPGITWEQLEKKNRYQRVDAAALPIQLSILFGWGLAGTGWRWVRLVRVWLVFGKRGFGPSCVAQWRSEGIFWE